MIVQCIECQFRNAVPDLADRFTCAGCGKTASLIEDDPPATPQPVPVSDPLGDFR